MTRAFVVKAIAEGCPVEGVFDELKSGRARIGWSYADKLDLRKIRTRPATDLDEEERAARRCLGFLARVGEGDYLLYPHQPKRNQFAVARVTGEYNYDGGIEEDFRSFRPCKLVTSPPVSRYDEIVPSELRHRLVLPGRFYEMYNIDLLQDFLQHLPKAGQILDGTNRVSIGRIHENLRERLPALIQQEFSRADLSRRLCRELFLRMGYTPDDVQVQEGRAEAGSDIVVTLGAPLLPDDGVRIGVQVFSYKDAVEENALKEKLDQLLCGWEDNEINYGVLLTTGLPSGPARAVLRSHNRNNPGRLVTLVDGESLSNLFLKYFPPASDPISENKNG